MFNFGKLMLAVRLRAGNRRNSMVWIRIGCGAPEQSIGGSGISLSGYPEARKPATASSEIGTAAGLAESIYSL